MSIRGDGEVSSERLIRYHERQEVKQGILLSVGACRGVAHWGEKGETKKMVMVH